MPVRTRFAPSPTGFLHVGGARTALFCYLQARRHGGQFILRIEDTDRERSTDEASEAILEAMAWLGLHYDEGPFYQTRRMHRYTETLKKLLNEGKAYPCYCSRERLAALRTEQEKRKEKPKYDGHCRNLQGPPPEGVNPVIRFRNPDEGHVTVSDRIRGEVTFSNAELDDLIIVRSDGTPTYNFTVVVDDADMGVTEVIRGDDHLNNTPRQINILRALGVEPPTYAHVPMILGQDGKRLSKRHGAMSVLQYRDDGYLPDAIINYLLRLGWAHGDQEIFTREEMIGLFDISNVQRAAASFDPDKLHWLNHQYLMYSDPKHVARHLEWHMQRLGIPYVDGPALADVVTAQSNRYKTLVEMAEKSRFFFTEFDDYDEKAARKNLNENTQSALAALLDALTAVDDWTAEAIQAAVQTTAERLDLKFGKVAQPLRVAVSGGPVSPPIDVTLKLLGRKKTLSRIRRGIDYIQASQEA